MNCDKQTGTGECESLARERIRYFTGRHMTARDFTAADAYHRTMRYLHNRVMHGAGIACGLEVMLHQRPECGVVVRCGLAIDCCGREVVVPESHGVRIDWSLWPKDATGQKLDPEFVLVLCLEYCETLTEKVPVLYSTTACSGAAYEDGRIREGYRLHWRAVRESELDQYGWHSAKGCPPDDEKDGGKTGPCCHDEHETSCCLEAKCPPCHCVPIAIVRGDEGKPELLSEGRPHAAHPPQQLTHICWTSWPHGGLVKLSEFKQLKVRFDRKLKDSKSAIEPGPSGISERTFVAQYGGQREDLDFVMFKDPPSLQADRRTALFEVLRPDEYLDSIIHVTLRCDFIVDCNDNPVDGNHLRGRLPSGDGVPGGTFESWFRVVRDDDYARLSQATPGVKS